VPKCAKNTFFKIFSKTKIYEEALNTVLEWFDWFLLIFQWHLEKFRFESNIFITTDLRAIIMY
jgi:hypothetical protein